MAQLKGIYYAKGTSCSHDFSHSAYAFLSNIRYMHACVHVYYDCDCALYVYIHVYEIIYAFYVGYFP